MSDLVSSKCNMRPSRAPLYVRLTAFLPPEIRDAIHDYVTGQESQFISSTVSTQERNYRRSRVLYNLGPHHQTFLEHLRARSDAVKSELDVGFDATASIECQVTAHNNGHFYKRHNDNGSAATRQRALTFVYYFSRVPPAFSGGELKLHYSSVKNGFYVARNRFEIIPPADNSIVFFASHHVHEVLPISCPSGRFEDSRFTVNGWMRRA